MLVNVSDAPLSAQSEAAENVLRLTDSAGAVLATLTLPMGTYAVDVYQRGEQALPIFGPAVVLRARSQGL